MKKSGSTGEQLKEAQAINKSLSALGDVISALASEQAHALPPGQTFGRKDEGFMLLMALHFPVWQKPNPLSSMGIIAAYDNDRQAEGLVLMFLIIAPALRAVEPLCSVIEGCLRRRATSRTVTTNSRC